MAGAGTAAAHTVASYIVQGPAAVGNLPDCASADHTAAGLAAAAAGDILDCIDPASPHELSD